MNSLDKAIVTCDSVEKKVVTNTIQNIKQILTSINTKVGAMKNESEWNEAYKYLLDAYESLRKIR